MGNERKDSKDRMVRIVQMETLGETCTRPIHRLCLLECPEDQKKLMTNNSSRIVGKGGVFQ